jgi:hypothetical protein
MKAKIEGWLEDAKRKRPALLILDGLDSLLAPEHEVCRYPHLTYVISS